MKSKDKGENKARISHGVATIFQYPSFRHSAQVATPSGSLSLIPEICTFNNIARRLKSALRSSLKVRLRCAYHPKSMERVGCLLRDIVQIRWAL